MLSQAPKNGPDGLLQLHASTVVINNKAVAVTGPSGSGKTSLAFAMMARGAKLLADDITWVEDGPHHLIARCPPTLSGKIEARGIGILAAPPHAPTPLELVVDLGAIETDRVPRRRTVTLLGRDIPLFLNPNTTYFSEAIVQYMTHGRAE